jgi:hypothetical protein
MGIVAGFQGEAEISRAKLLESGMGRKSINPVNFRRIIDSFEREALLKVLLYRQ